MIYDGLSWFYLTASHLLLWTGERWMTKFTPANEPQTNVPLSDYSGFYGPVKITVILKGIQNILNVGIYKISSLHR